MLSENVIFECTFWYTGFPLKRINSTTCRCLASYSWFKANCMSIDLYRCFLVFDEIVYKLVDTVPFGERILRGFPIVWCIRLLQKFIWWVWCSLILLINDILWFEVGLIYLSGFHCSKYANMHGWTRFRINLLCGVMWIR